MATMPMRGPATVIEMMMTALMSPPSSIHFGPEKPACTPIEAAPGDQEHDERRDGADEDGARDRLEAADAVAETALRRDLQRAAETGDERERRGDSCRAHGVTLYAPFP